jgi:hypothetical protein
MAALGRSMVTNAVTRPDFIAFELAILPDRFASFWRGPHRPLIGYTTHSDAEEERARGLVDGFFFSGYVPAVYR